MALSFLYFISDIQSFNTLSKTIMSLPRTLHDHMFIQNNIFMVKTIYVRGPTLARLAMVLVVEPAVNRQPGFRRELVEQIASFIINSRDFLHQKALKYKFPNSGGVIPIFPWKFENFIIFSTFWKREGPVQNKGLIELES